MSLSDFETQFSRSPGGYLVSEPTELLVILTVLRLLSGKGTGGNNIRGGEQEVAVIMLLRRHRI